MVTGDSGQLGAPVSLEGEHAPGDVTNQHHSMEEEIVLHYNLETHIVNNAQQVCFITYLFITPTL